MIEGALKKSKFQPSKVIVWQRDEKRWDPVVKENGERNWQRLVKSAKNRGIKADAVPVKSHEGLYIIYTSGTICPWKTWIKSIDIVYRNYWITERSVA